MVQEKGRKKWGDDMTLQEMAQRVMFAKQQGDLRYKEFIEKLFNHWLMKLHLM